MYSTTQTLLKLMFGGIVEDHELIWHDGISRLNLLQIGRGEELDFHEVLYRICESEHAHCNVNCPVFDMMDDDERYNLRRGDCPCFKRGDKMKKFILKRLSQDADQSLND